MCLCSIILDFFLLLYDYYLALFYTEVALEASLQSFSHPRSLTVTINERQVATVRVGVSPKRLRIPFVIGPGPQQIRFAATPEASSPAAGGLSADVRDLAIGVRGTRIVADR